MNDIQENTAESFLCRVLRVMDRNHAVEKYLRNPPRSSHVPRHPRRSRHNERTMRFARQYLGRVAAHLNPRMETEPWAAAALAEAWYELEATA